MSSSPPKKLRPYGKWKSNITPALASNKLRLSDVQFTGDGLLWLEGRSEGSVLVHTADNSPETDVAVHYQPRGGLAYGGGEFHTRQDLIVFVNKDGRLFRTSIQKDICHPITPGFGSSSSPAISPDGHFVLFIHSDGKDDSIGLADLEKPEWPVRLVYGADFYMQPVWHPEGDRIAWVEWNNPNMAWDGSTIKLAKFDRTARTVRDIRTIAGDAGTPVFQPEFSPDSRYLSYLTGAGDMDELVLMDLASGNKMVLLENKVMITPAWTHGQRVYGWTADSKTIFCISQNNGLSEILEVGVEDNSIRALDPSPYSIFSQLSVSPTNNDLCCLASSPTEPTSIIRISSGKARVIRSSMDISQLKGEISSPNPLQWTGRTGETIHGNYYPPLNSKFRSEGPPPTVIHIHGGPTSQADPGFAFDTTFFTNRGYAYLALNYRGSTGYGRDYQKALNQHWGEYDVEDTISAVHYLIENGLADPTKLVIKGSSAGGYTLLNSLIRYPELFRAAICSFPVANLLTIIDETFKFEAHYYDSLIGPYPQEKQKYIDWSPIEHVDEIRTPMILFHGDSDPVVPSSQSTQIVEALKTNHVPHTFKLFSGEGHGWRKAETLKTYYQMIELFLKDYVLPE